MSSRTRLATGLVISVAAAVLMATGVLGLEPGLVVGTIGVLIVATRSYAKNPNANQDKAT